MQEEQPSISAKPKKDFKLNFKIVSIVLLVVVLLLVVLWRPWVRAIAANSRTVQVTGQATVKSEPDQFVFYATYTSKNTDQVAAMTELAKKSDEIVSKLKSLGVSENNIKTNASSNGGKYMITAMYPMPGGNLDTTLQVTVTVVSKDAAQKVQDYLQTTSASGSVSPNPSFSDAKQKQLESQARDEATKDARSKAEQMAKNLGFKIGAVKTVQDQAGFGEIMPMSANVEAGSAGVVSTNAGGTVTTTAMPAQGAINISSADTKAAGIAVLPGQNEVSYSVGVTYFVK